ncbi:MAG: nickel-dependent hydrogenase large subunit, partial [Desulfurobacteriaceae bacterium]
MKKELNINHLTRVEGHGAVDIVIENSRLSEIRLRFTEGPRFFEVITRDRLYTEIPKIVSRICGICYVSHRLASVFAIEDAFGVKVNRGIELLRSLLTVGEFLESHSLHIYFLALPDYMGYPSTLAMVKDYPNVVKRGFKLKEVGNRIMKLIGGKTVHGENILVGGFASIPSREELEEVGRSLLKLIP